MTHDFTGLGELTASDITMQAKVFGPDYVLLPLNLFYDFSVANLHRAR